MMPIFRSSVKKTDVYISLLIMYYSGSSSLFSFKDFIFEESQALFVITSVSGIVNDNYS